MLNVIIPAAGNGSRFKQTHSLPKPLIQVNNNPMLIEAVRTLDLDARYHFLLRNDEYLDRISFYIKNTVPNATILTVDTTTEGAACSGLLFEKYIGSNDELIIANCDQIMNWDSSHALNCFRQYDGAVVTYKSTDPKNSFARIEGQYVTEVVEKNPISDSALVGIHYWANAGYFFDSANRMIENNDRTNNEFYVAPTYNYLIRDGLNIGSYEITTEEFYPVGTPEDLRRYESRKTV